MRQLRYLKPGDDGKHVILETADGSEQFVLFITPPMRDAVRADLPKLQPAEPQPEPEPAISPREIQMRVRGGVDPQYLADSTGMDIDKILRFAGPVLEERARMADEARRARARRGTIEGQTVIFGEAVDERFSMMASTRTRCAGIRSAVPTGSGSSRATWTLEDETEHRADFAFHLTARNVSPMDDPAVDLLSDTPIRRSEPERDLSDAPALAPGVVAFPRLAPPPADDDDEDVVTALDEAADDVFDQDAAEGSDELPLHIAEDSADDSQRARTAPLPKVKNLGIAHRDEQRKTNPRPKVPSWDDIVLGVRRTTD